VCQPKASGIPRPAPHEDYARVFDRSLPQVLETQQYGEHPFELAVEMDRGRVRT
jgi:hypothetical protein